MKKPTTEKPRQKIADVFIIFVAFLLGALVYFVSAIGVDKFTPKAGAASGAWHQVTVKVGVCDCITEFQPDPMLPGAGTADDPFVSDNTGVDVSVTVNGTGHITIEDENGNIVAEWDQSVGDDPTRIVHVDFPSVGDHKLIVKINGAEVTANGVSAELYFRIGKLPPIIPDIPLPWIPGLPNVPNTGYIYIAGYAVQVYSLLIGGIIAAIIARFLLIGYRRKQKINETSVRVFEKKTKKRKQRSR